MTEEVVDLLLINPGDKKQVYQKLGPVLSAIEPPIWAGLIAAFIRAKGYNVQILDANAESLDPVDTAERVSEIAPRLTAVVVYGQNPSASTMVMPAAGAICQEIKRLAPEKKIILVGGHVAALPERTLLEEDTDFVCDGEGPYTIMGLLDAPKQNHPSIDKVRGLLHHENGEVVRNLSASLIINLGQEMPSIAWDLLPMDKYRAHNWHCFTHIDNRKPYAALYTTLGCPFHCDFCCIQAPFKQGEQSTGYSPRVNSYRRWSPESIIKQIDILVNEYGVKNIKFADEIFVLNKKHISGICDLIIERKYDLNIWVYARVDSWSPEILEKMKSAGINWICLGIESGSERVRDNVHKGYKHGDVYKAVDAIRNAGINIISNYLFGLPEDNIESMQETLDLAFELNCEFANFYCAMAYPGSKLYERAVAENLPLPKSWTGYSQYSFDTLPLPTKYLSGIDVLKFRDQAFNKYFTNPAYLELIFQKFGPKAVAHIKEMTSHSLERKYL